MDRVNEQYMRAYMEGYTAAKAQAVKDEKKPYLDKDDIIARYDNKIGVNKAREIIQAVRHACGGGKLNSSSLVLLSEVEYWESLVDKRYIERL